MYWIEAIFQLFGEWYDIFWLVVSTLPKNKHVVGVQHPISTLEKQHRNKNNDFPVFTNMYIYNYIHTHRRYAHVGYTSILLYCYLLRWLNPLKSFSPCLFFEYPSFFNISLEKKPGTPRLPLPGSKPGLLKTKACWWVLGNLGAWENNASSWKGASQ